MNWRSLDLNLLVVFDTIARERSVARAGRTLDMSASAVSHALARLRRALDDELFERVPEGLAPTHRAKELMGPVQGALAQLQAVLSPTFDPSSSRRDFTVALDNRSALILAAPLARLVSETAPHVDLVIVPAGPQSLADRLDGGGLDVVVSASPAGGRGLSAEALFEDGFAVLVRQGHPAAVGGGLALADLAAHPHLSISSTGDDHGFVDAQLASAGLSRRIALHAPLHSVQAIMPGSELLAVMGERTALAFARMAGLEVLRLPFEPPRTTTSMTWHRHLDDAPAHRWLRSTVVSAAALVA